MNLLIKISLGIFSVLFLNSCKKDEVPTSVTDKDGNVYKVVTIGTQAWLQENLKSTKLNDGTSIPIVTENSQWSQLQSPGACYLNNDEATNKDTYGALYNWYTVKTGHICPVGWHVPTKDEVNTLVTYLGGPGKAWLKLMETGPEHWSTFPNPGTNESVFTALPGRLRYTSGSFTGVPEGATWWISNENNDISGFSWYVVNGAAIGFSDNAYKQFGLSVRCIQN
jgi:uncharacterized protein (TIGR02145 family)